MQKHPGISWQYKMIIYFLKMICNDVILKGIKNITDVFADEEHVIRFDNNTGDIKKEKEHVIVLSGINFEKIKYIKGIDNTRTTCNDIDTIFRLYGIEATRSILINEFEMVYRQSNINSAHLTLLVDQMTHLGEIISIDRHGLNKLESSPLSKVSFEQQMEHFINAAIFNEKDYINSVSSRIAIGKTINGGTTSFNILFDTDKLHNSEYTENEISKTTFISLEEEPLITDIMKYKLPKHNCFIP
jgi:DNA-directed RNA polymerase II subunit RPB1